MSDCIFCKISKDEIPSQSIFENSKIKVIVDRYPANKGHILIVPKQHIENIFDIDPAYAGRLFELAAKMATVVKNTFNCENINIVQNNGPLAGQTVNHFHIHIIPRFEGDNVNVSWPQMEMTEEEFKAIAAELREFVRL
jgi:histidine triad (HIT) family protein